MSKDYLITVEDNELNPNLPHQVVGLICQNRDTKELFEMRVRVHSINLDDCIIDAIKQIHGVETIKGYDRQIRGTRNVSTNRVLGAWLVP